MSAVAVMIALVGAMFVALAPARAHDVGSCIDPEYLTEDACRENVKVDNDDDPGTPDDVINDSDNENDPWTSDGHTASNHPPTLTVTVLDSDGIVNDDSTVMVSVTSSGLFLAALGADAPAEGSPSGGLVLEYVRVSGELENPVDVTDETEAARTLGPTPSGTDDASVSTQTFEIIIPDGTTEGEYTVSARVSGYDYDQRSGDDPESTRVSGSAKFTVGDAGAGIGSAELALGNRLSDDARTVEDEAREETGSDVADNDGSETNPAGINLVVSASNSLGNKSNASDVSQITVIAPGGKITIDSSPAGVTPVANEHTVTGTNSASLAEDTALTTGTELEGDEIGQSIAIAVEKANGKPGSVDVYAIVTGATGAAVTETITLSFTGDASSLSLGDASGSLHNQIVVANNDDGDDTDHRDVISFGLSASDSGGNDAGIPTVRAKITDPKGKTVSTTRIARSQGPNAIGTKNAKITLTSMGMSTAPLAGGEYMLTVTAGGNSAEASFFVAGAAKEIEISTESSSDPIALGSVVTVTANVTDGDVAVADGTEVEFTPAGALKLSGVGETDSVKTKAGVATARFVVSEGSGLAAIIVSSGTASNSASINTGPAEAMPEEEASLSCLSSLSGFSTWTCDVEASASEIFDWISSRGATALHLNSNRMWVRYSVVDGAMVPGSSDFMVTKSDILYISN